MKNRELATAARELVKGKWESEKRIDTAAKFEYAAASVAASIQADAKELLAAGEIKSALDAMNMVSVITQDIAGVTFSSPSHRAVALFKFQKDYGRPYGSTPVCVRLGKKVIGYKPGEELGMPIGEHAAFQLEDYLDDGRFVGSAYNGHIVLFKPEEVKWVCA
jgi:hypothetical protein